MKLVCVVTKTNDYNIEGGTLIANLIDVPENKDVEEVINNWEAENGEEVIQYFFVSQAARTLLAVAFPDFEELDEDVELPIALHAANETFLEACRTFVVPQLTPAEALRKLNDRLIDKALDLGWKPSRQDILDRLGDALDDCEDGQLADRYREDLLLEAEDDIRVAVERFSMAQSIFRDAAGEYLEGYTSVT